MIRRSRLILAGSLLLVLIVPSCANRVPPPNVRPDEVAEGPPADPGDCAEAPSGFDRLTNGFVDQQTFDDTRREFEEAETIETGLGPVFNARACVDCHDNPPALAGGGSQITELHAWHNRLGKFVAPPGGTLIQDRAIDPAIQERVPKSEDIRDFRLSLSTLGDGFVEAVDNRTLAEIAWRQFEESDGRVAGFLPLVPVLEGVEPRKRVGRFGWKSQHASLVSFSAAAYLDEMGITSPLAPMENTSLGRSVAPFDRVADPENDGDAIMDFATFIRATKAPPVTQALSSDLEAIEGLGIFEQVGCATCHVPTLVTARAGTTINAGAFVVPPVLGCKLFHPFGDYLLHDVGTGDGIEQNGDQRTRLRMRTAPLWGLSTRTRLMHDGRTLTVREAIERHRGEADGSRRAWRRLSSREKGLLLAFLDSL